VKTSFDEQVRRFITNRSITGVDMKVEDDLRLLVAASAATLSAGWPGYEWSQVAEVLLYPNSFDRDFVVGPQELAGLADHWGTVVISAPALCHSFEVESDGYHVGLHEFAHLLQESASPSGVPRSLRSAEVREWDEIYRQETETVRLGGSVLDPYGGSSPQEFFPVAVETFFERAGPLRERHEALYAFLRAYFGQDPAAWADPSTGLKSACICG
jgi:MtfA peptidase